MHSILFRANALLTFAVTVLAALCTLASLTDSLHAADPPVHVQLSRVEYFGRVPGGPLQGSDEARLVLDVSADLRDVFTWNTKQVFVYICAQYDTSRMSVSQVSLWDYIIQDKAQAQFHFPELRAKYGFVDQGNTLRGQPFNLTLHWNVMPISGALREGSKSFSGFRLPNDYL